MPMEIGGFRHGLLLDSKHTDLISPILQPSIAGLGRHVNAFAYALARESWHLVLEALGMGYFTSDSLWGCGTSESWAPDESKSFARPAILHSSSTSFQNNVLPPIIARRRPSLNKIRSSLIRIRIGGFRHGLLLDSKAY